MTPADVEQEVLDSLRAYWRLKAALAIVAQHPGHQDLLGLKLEFAGVPVFGLARGFLAAESVNFTIQQLGAYVDNRAAADLFLAMIASLEKFLVDLLVAKGVLGAGTLGQLQASVQQKYTIPSSVIEDLNEVRERRNSLIHEHGRVTTKWSNAAASVRARATVPIEDPAHAYRVAVSAEYLSYCAHVLINYSQSVK